MPLHLKFAQALRQPWLPLGLLVVLLLGWLALEVGRLEHASPLNSPLYDGWRYRLERPQAGWGQGDGGLEVLRLLAPKIQLPETAGVVSEGEFSLLASRAGLGGRWLRQTGERLNRLQPPFVALMHQPIRRYVLVQSIGSRFVTADDPQAGRVAFRREGFERALIGPENYGMVYVLSHIPQPRQGKP